MASQTFKLWYANSTLQIEYFLLLSFYFMHTSGVDHAIHVICSIVKIAVDRLSLDIVFKIYKYFDIYTIRIAQLKGFCDFVDTKSSAVSQRG